MEAEVNLEMAYLTLITLFETKFQSYTKVKKKGFLWDV